MLYLFCEWSEFVVDRIRRGWNGWNGTFFSFTGPDGKVYAYLCTNGSRSYFGQGAYDLGPVLRQYYKLTLLWPAFAQAWSARQERLFQRGIARVRIRNIAKYHNLPEDIERVILTYIG